MIRILKNSLVLLFFVSTPLLAVQLFSPSTQELDDFLERFIVFADEHELEVGDYLKTFNKHGINDEDLRDLLLQVGPHGGEFVAELREHLALNDDEDTGALAAVNSSPSTLVASPYMHLRGVPALVALEVGSARAAHRSPRGLPPITRGRARSARPAYDLPAAPATAAAAAAAASGSFL